MKDSYDFSNGKRGPVMPVDPGMTRITIRLDKDIIDWFRQQVNEAGGGNYQTQINAVLRRHIDNARNPGLEEQLSKVDQEELRAAG